MGRPVTALAFVATCLLVVGATACTGGADPATSSSGTATPEPAPGGQSAAPSASDAGVPTGVTPSPEATRTSARPPEAETDANVVFDGDSLTAGYMLPASASYPAQLMAELPSAIEWVNVAVSGQVWPQLLADAETDVDARFRPDRAANVVVAWAAANDLAAGYTAAEIYRNARAYCEGRRAKGFRVIVLTMYPLQPKDVDPGYDETRRAYNELLRKGWKEFADGLVDVAADTRIGDRSGPERSAYFIDLVHLNRGGYGVIADCVRPVLVRVLSR